MPDRPKPAEGSWVSSTRRSRKLAPPRSRLVIGAMAAPASFTTALGTERLMSSSEGTSTLPSVSPKLSDGRPTVPPPLPSQPKSYHQSTDRRSSSTKRTSCSQVAPAWMLAEMPWITSRSMVASPSSMRSIPSEPAVPETTPIWPMSMVRSARAITSAADGGGSRLLAQPCAGMGRSHDACV